MNLATIAHFRTNPYLDPTTPKSVRSEPSHFPEVQLTI